MKNIKAVKVLGLVMAIVFCYAGIVGADSDIATGAGASASVDLDFQIVIPSFIYFRVGSAGSTVDTVSFAPTAAQVAAGTQDIAGTGGDLTGGAVTVNLISNGGAVTIDANGNGGLSDGSNTIDFATISTVSSDTDLPAPTLSNATSSSSPTSTGNITNLSAQWTYDFDMPATDLEAGTYSGTVTYTASIP